MRNEVLLCNVTAYEIKMKWNLNIPNTVLLSIPRMNPISFLHPKRSIKGNAHPFFSVKSNLANVKNKRKNLEMTVNESSIFFAIS